MLTPHAANQLRLQLRAIPDLCEQAYEDLEPSGTAGSGMPTGTRTPPIPARLDILSLLGPAAAGDVHDPYGDQVGDRPVSAVLSAWCELIWGYPCHSIPTAVRILLNHHNEAVLSGYCDDYAAEIQALYRRLSSLARTYAPPLPLRCPRCRQLTLESDPGRGYLCCDPDCPTTLSPDLYDHLAEQQEYAQLIRNAARRQRAADTAAAASAAAEAEEAPALDRAG